MKSKMNLLLETTINCAVFSLSACLWIFIGVIFCHFSVLSYNCMCARDTFFFFFFSPTVPVLASLLVVKGSAYGFSAPKSHFVENQSCFVNLTITFNYFIFVFFVLSVLC